ncbi:MAG: serine/threonine-protein kinase [Verrucomicrobiota bacterium]
MSGPEPGSMLANRYEVVRKLGAGGLGEVFECLDIAKNRRVAVKRLHQSGEELGYSSDTTVNEARTLASLRHPNILKIYDLAWDQGKIIIVMELVEGKTLSSIVKERPLTLSEFIALATQILEGVGAAHRRGLLHLDIKPANIMLEPIANSPFKVKLLDFGLAQIRNQAPIRTNDGSIMGSIYFIAPEQLHAEPLSERTDIYAVGHVFYNALCGRVAFPYRNFEDVIQAQLHKDPKHLAELCPDVSVDLCNWIHWFLEKDTDSRPRSTQDALRELTKIITTFEVHKVEYNLPSNVMPQAEELETPKKGLDSVKSFIKDRFKTLSNDRSV